MTSIRAGADESGITMTLAITREEREEYETQFLKSDGTERRDEQIENTYRNRSALEVPIRSEEDFLREAGCLAVGPEVFYFEPEEDPDKLSAAKAICATCVEREACLEKALKNKEKIGVWGGLSPMERRRLLRQRRRAEA